MKVKPFSQSISVKFVVPVALLVPFALFVARAQDPAQEPEPPIITPGEFAAPPSDAVIIFDGKSTSNLVTGKGEAIKWKLENGYLEANRSGGIFSKEEFGNCQLHVEFATPSVVEGEGQGRGNSGVYLMGRYEIQVLDSYNNKTYPNGQCGAFYGNKAPLVNASRKPGEWQSFDIFFHTPKPLDGGKVEPGSFTVIHNGVLIQDHTLVTGPPSTSSPKQGFAEKGPLYLQDHGNPIRYRNIWFRRL